MYTQQSSQWKNFFWPSFLFPCLLEIIISLYPNITWPWWNYAQRFFWWSLFLILYLLPISKRERNNGIGAPVFSNPNGTISGKAGEMLFNGGIGLAAPELRSALASLQWCSSVPTMWQHVKHPNSIWHGAHVTPIRHPYKKKVNLNHGTDRVNDICKLGTS